MPSGPIIGPFCVRGIHDGEDVLPHEFCLQRVIQAVQTGLPGFRVLRSGGSKGIRPEGLGFRSGTPSGECWIHAPLVAHVPGTETSDTSMLPFWVGRTTMRVGCGTGIWVPVPMVMNRSSAASSTKETARRTGTALISRSIEAWEDGDYASSWLAMNGIMAVQVSHRVNVYARFESSGGGGGGGGGGPEEDVEEEEEEGDDVDKKNEGAEKEKEKEEEAPPTSRSRGAGANLNVDHVIMLHTNVVAPWLLRKVRERVERGSVHGSTGMVKKTGDVFQESSKALFAWVTEGDLVDLWNST